MNHDQDPQDLPQPVPVEEDLEPAMAVLYEDEQPVLMLSGADELPTEKEKSLVGAKVSALGLAILVHVVLAFLLAAVFVIVPGPPSSEITALSAPATQEQAPQIQKVVEQPPQPTVSQSATTMRFMTSTNASAVAMPTVDFDISATELDMGTTMGSFEANIGASMGGSISFMGNAGQGRRVVFAVDASASMNSRGKRGKGKGKKGPDAPISKFELMKKELDDSIKKLPPGTEYQILFFSAFAWPHDEIDTRNKAQWESYRWKIAPNDPSPEIPKFKYLRSTTDQTKKSRQIIQETATTLGTLWGPPVLMALSIRPKPDIVFFMTDGATGNPRMWIDMINAANKKGGKRAVIHTTAMMEPDAAKDLSDLAIANGGEFTIIGADGKTTKGVDYFKAQAAMPK
ncbi:MAG: hypothetical protein KDK97_16225 [Verrucomicrobiales bacterium]|nr:hypothetical protein [Verrucomicrobiales bacterium]MCP5559992.1 hypothetical protein [Verrucomicrobiaceae bacterium]